MNLEIEIYDHILDLIKNAADLRELENWLSRERDLLKTELYKFNHSFSNILIIYMKTVTLVIKRMLFIITSIFW